MWTCSDLKKSAWKSLAPRFGWALLIVFLYQMMESLAGSIISGLTDGLFPVLSEIKSVIVLLRGQNNLSDAFIQKTAFHLIFTLFTAFLWIVPVSGLLHAIFTIFLKDPLMCGILKWFIDQRGEKRKPAFESVFGIFRSNNYSVIVKGMAWRYLWLCLWGAVSGLPFLLPAACTIFIGRYSEKVISSVQEQTGMSGASAWIEIALILLLLYLIASFLSMLILLSRYYSYFYVPFILNEESGLGFRDTMNRSKKMTKGQKANICALDLSFLGWWILVAFSCGLLTFVLMPYIYATYTELYFTRKSESASFLKNRNIWR